MVELGDGDGDGFQLTINEEFAKKYEARKRGEELSALKEKYAGVEGFDAERALEAADRRRKYGIGTVDQAAAFDAACDDGLESSEEDDDDDEEEDEYAEMLTPEVDLQVLKTLARIKSQDPEIYDSGKSYFTEEEIGKARLQWKQKQQEIQKSKPLTLKDYHRKTLLEEVGLAPEGEPAGTAQSKTFTHVEEQEQLRDELRAAVSLEAGGADDGDEDSFLTRRTKSADEIKLEEEEYRRFLIDGINNDGGKSAEALREWQTYAYNPNVDEDESFLMNYILNRGWLAKGSMVTPSYNDIVDDSSDEAAFENAERFESTFNHRFEEEGGTQIVTHARYIDGLVRRKDNKRQLQRRAAAQRKAEERKRKEEELKRLKNLKKEEIRQRLLKIREVAGVGGAGTGGGRTGLGIEDLDFEATLEGDFDPDAHDRIMAKAFNDDYYNDGNAHIKPVFEDDIDVSDFLGSTGAAGGEGADVRQNGSNRTKNKKKKKKKKEPRLKEDEFIMDADHVPEAGEYPEESCEGNQGEGYATEHRVAVPAMRAKAAALNNKRSLDEYLNEYYQLDYEDMIGDLPTRFKYARTKPADYGLTPAEILLADDAEMNEFYSLKKLAPYRAAHKQEADRRKFAAKRKSRLRDFRQKLEERVQEDPELAAIANRPTWRIGSAARKQQLEQAEQAANPKKRKRNEKRRERAKKARKFAAAGGAADELHEEGEVAEEEEEEEPEEVERPKKKRRRKSAPRV